jgi:hypothetical protein
MKVYNKEDFLRLPQGTIFSQGDKWCFQGLSVKGVTLDSYDFCYTEMIDISSSGSDQWVDRLEDSLKNGTSYEINRHSQRDGLFDPTSVYLVFEIDDLKEIIYWCKQQIKYLNAIKKSLD